MAKRVIMAGVLGGIAMYVWTSLAHVVLPLGAIGVSTISKNEESLLASMHATLGETHGFYAFPNVGDATDAAALQQYAQKVANGPSGLLVYHPSGGQALAPSQLITEFLIELIQALLVVVLLAQTRLETFGSRVGFVTLAGVLAALATNVSYWNWYGFPASYTVSYIFIQIAGFAVVGVVAGILMRSPVRMTAAVPA
jgi:hypothetical protein